MSTRALRPASVLCRDTAPPHQLQARVVRTRLPRVLKLLSRPPLLLERVRVSGSARKREARPAQVRVLRGRKGTPSRTSPKVLPSEDSQKSLPDQTSKATNRRDRLLSEAPSSRRCTSRKKQDHGLSNVDVPTFKYEHTVEEPTARCEWCRRIGTRVLFRARRFQR